MKVPGIEAYLKVLKSWSKKLQKVYFLVIYAQKKNFDVMAGQNEARVTKGHQLQIFEKWDE